MIRLTPRHLYFYLVVSLTLTVFVIGFRQLTNVNSGALSYVDDIPESNNDQPEGKEMILPDTSLKKDQHDAESDIANYLNTNDDDRLDDISGLTDEEIREQLEQIKKKQNLEGSGNTGKEATRNSDLVSGTLLDNTKRTRVDAPPDGQKWASYELDRKIPEDGVNNYPRLNATLFTLCRNKELYDILDSIQQMENRFNSKHNYDWVFVNDEPFTDEFIELTSNMVSGRARYGLIPYEHWSYPDHVDQEKAKSVRESKKWSTVTYGASESYRHMCRYNSLFFHKHPIMEEYQYFWRVEPQVSYGCDILEDPFKTLANEKKMYGFTITMQELPNTIETLWSTSKLYFDQAAVKEQLPEDNLIEFVSDDNGETYNLCHYWSNFEVVNLDFYRSDLYEGYVNHLDQAGGFFYERWGDAPIHSIAASLMLKKDEIHIYQNISYSHTVATTCPLNDYYLKEARCTCDPKNDWTMGLGSSCNIKYFETSGQEKNADFDKYFTAMKRKIIEDEEIKKKQRQLRLETARRQAASRKAKAQERKNAREAQRKERERQRQEKEGAQ